MTDKRLIQLSIDENLFKSWSKTALSRHGYIRGWMSKAMMEAMKLYIEKYD